MILMGVLLNILVTVSLNGKTVYIERLPEEYSVTTDACQRDADRLRLRGKPGKSKYVITIQCVHSLTRRI
jgi:hypothetical protein